MDISKNFHQFLADDWDMRMQAEEAQITIQYIQHGKPHRLERKNLLQRLGKG